MQQEIYQEARQVAQEQWIKGKTEGSPFLGYDIDHYWVCFSYQLNAQFLYSKTIYMLHYNPRHVSSINMPIFRRTNCIITASGIVTLCKRLYSMQDERPWGRFSL